MELMRKSRLEGSFNVSLEAKASNTNWKLGIASGVSLRNWTSKPINWMLLTTTFPSNKGFHSNRVVRRCTFSISSPSRSFNLTSSMCRRLRKPNSIWPTETSVFNSLLNSEDMAADNFFWTKGTFKRINRPIWMTRNPHTSIRIMYFMRLLKTIIMQKYKYRMNCTLSFQYIFYPFHRKSTLWRYKNCISKDGRRRNVKKDIK